MRLFNNASPLSTLQCGFLMPVVSIGPLNSLDVKVESLSHRNCCATEACSAKTVSSVLTMEVLPRLRNGMGTGNARPRRLLWLCSSSRLRCAVHQSIKSIPWMSSSPLQMSLNCSHGGLRFLS